MVCSIESSSHEAKTNHRYTPRFTASDPNVE
jgi:hypothetical protein